MNEPVLQPLGRLSRSLLAFRRQRNPGLFLKTLPHIAVSALAVTTLADAALFRDQLLESIDNAQGRIFLAALYLQDDTAGREIMDALYAAHRRCPEMEIAVFVDWHRAQRGLIGKAQTANNATMYREYAARFGTGVKIYGVPVQTRELFGVLHLKGFIIDDTVIYSGASLNDVYLARHGRYRLDRYHLIRDPVLAEGMVEFLRRLFVGNDAVRMLNQGEIPATRVLRAAIRKLRARMQQAQYRIATAPLSAGDVGVTPLAGFGRNDSELNAALVALVRSATRKVTILTPYFNLPSVLRGAVGALLKRGCSVTIVVGDKTANDFFIPPDEPFKTIGQVPYLYESNLRRFARAHQRHIDQGLLNLLLWKHGDNSYHAKGMFIDDSASVLTGSNFNPRAWTLDLENALVLSDPHGLLRAQNEAELERICRHATRLSGYLELESLRNYPEPVKKVLRRLSRTRLDRLLNRIL
ncbi:MAG: CDP-diacylglycerol--serine O-phosphatidyltransferase [Betaproteobacteria bacterium]|nr:CDP-diacylglycerol--serine O-phosphatidyltransferase [Betaproteobacteria bacterium]